VYSWITQIRTREYFETEKPYPDLCGFVPTDHPDPQVKLTTMPLVTRTAAKGIPPKVRQPKRKGKLTTKKNQKGKTNKNGKRPAASEEDEDLESSSDESELPPKKKRNKKQQLKGVEVLEDEPEVEPPEENVEVINVDASPGSDDEL
jgi:hypothetical protein